MTARQPLPQPGQSWTVAAALLQLLADTPVTVTAVRAGVVHFSTASGAHLALPLGTYRGLFQQAEP